MKTALDQKIFMDYCRKKIFDYLCSSDLFKIILEQ